MLTDLRIPSRSRQSADVYTKSINPTEHLFKIKCSRMRLVCGKIRLMLLGLWANLIYSSGIIILCLWLNPNLKFYNLDLCLGAVPTKSFTNSNLKYVLLTLLHRDLRIHIETAWVRKNICITLIHNEALSPTEYLGCHYKFVANFIQ